jgi:hypothetical protein
MRHEDPNDPEHNPAAHLGVTVDGETSWFLEDREQAITIVQHSDGTWTAAIQDFAEEVDE